MRDSMSRYFAGFAANFGRCTTCMRQSLAAMLTMWTIFAIGTMTWPGILVDYVTGSTAVALTALWLLHIAVHAARAVAVSSSVRIDDGFDDVGRRQALRTLLRAAGVGVVASVPVLLLPSAAFAFCGQCTKNSDCGVGWVCRNTAPVNSGRVCNECVRA